MKFTMWNDAEKKKQNIQNKAVQTKLNLYVKKYTQKTL